MSAAESAPPRRPSRSAIGRGDLLRGVESDADPQQRARLARLLGFVEKEARGGERLGSGTAATVEEPDASVPRRRGLEVPAFTPPLWRTDAVEHLEEPDEPDGREEPE